MKFRSVTNSTKNRYSHLVRGVALFFVLFMGLDAAFPQYCAEMAAAFPFGGNGVAVVTAADTDRAEVQDDAASVSPRESRRNQAQNGAPHDGHCISFCSHITPGTVFLTVTPPGYERSVSTSRQNAAPLSPTLRGPYHPPKLA